VSVKVFSEKGGVLQIAVKGKKQTVIAEVVIPKGSNWTEIKKTLLKTESGIQNLIISSKDDNQIEVDWIKFEQ
jgi:hypothetical protein